MSNSSTDTYDVAIVGGGVAGCYVAYRLLQATPDDFEEDSPLLSIVKDRPLKVALFEYAGRVGGRLVSTQLPEMPNYTDEDALNFAEFGGFRFQPQMHIVGDLVDHLGLTFQPFPVDEPGENFVYVRGQRLRKEQLTSQYISNNPDYKPPYNLAENEQGMSPDDLTTYVYNQCFQGVLPNYDPQNPPPDIPPPDDLPDAPNGYSYLRYQYQTAFQLAREALCQTDTDDPNCTPDQNKADQFWQITTDTREQLESAKQKAMVNGRLLTDWSWWALKKQFLSQEALDYIEDTGGYNVLFTSGNISSPVGEDFYFAGESDVFGTQPYPYQALPPEDTVWKHVVEGYSAIPLRCYETFLGEGVYPQTNYDDQQGQAFLQYQLFSFDKADGDGGYDLTFFLRETGTTPPNRAEAACQQNPDNCKTIKATYVVLALPQRALALIDQNNFFFNDQTVEQLLNTVVNDDAIRLFMAYDEPWWTKASTEGSGAENNQYPPLTRGRSTTDLPVRQFYYWLTEDGNKSFLLASYTNGQGEKFWEGIQVVPPGQPPYDTLKGSAHPQVNVVAPAGFGPRAAPKNMAELAHEMIVEVVGPLTDGNTPPKPYYAHYQNWTKDPWGAGWHAWLSGVNDDKTIPEILQPLPNENIFICGESYSNVQGWVQGALNSSEVMLQNKLGLKWPSWLSTGGTWLGPGSTDPTT